MHTFMHKHTEDTLAHIHIYAKFVVFVSLFPYISANMNIQYYIPRFNLLLRTCQEANGHKRIDRWLYPHIRSYTMSKPMFTCSFPEITCWSSAIFISGVIGLLVLVGSGNPADRNNLCWWVFNASWCLIVCHSDSVWYLCFSQRFRFSSHISPRKRLQFPSFKDSSPPCRKLLCGPFWELRDARSDEHSYYQGMQMESSMYMEN